MYEDMRRHYSWIYFLLQYSTWQVVREVRTLTAYKEIVCMQKKKIKKNKSSDQGFMFGHGPSCQLNSSIQDFKYKQLYY